MINIFKRAILEKLIVNLTFKTNSGRVLTRKCVPFDYGPSRKVNSVDKSNKFHFLDLESNGIKHQHPLPVKQGNIIKLSITDENFNPGDYINLKWYKPYNWFIPRDWGIYS